MKKKQVLHPSPNPEKQTMIVKRVYSSAGKSLVAVIGQRSKKGNAHLKEVKAVILKEVNASNPKQD